MCVFYSPIEINTIHVIQVNIHPDNSAWEQLQRRPELHVNTLFDTVQTVLNEVRDEGDDAVRRYGERFDKVRIDTHQVSPEEIQQADALLSDELKQAIRTAQQNIHTFHAAQRFEGKKIETMPGVTCWQKAMPIEKVGLYIPGGTAPLFSTVLMLAIPARIAGCQEIVLCTPLDKAGLIHPAILFAAPTAGLSHLC